MSVLNKGLLLQTARLEHMGKLTRTAKLFEWVETAQDVHGNVVYKNNTLRMALLPTKEVYLMQTSAHIAQRGHIEGGQSCEPSHHSGLPTPHFATGLAL